MTQSGLIRTYRNRLKMGETHSKSASVAGGRFTVLRLLIAVCIGLSCMQLAAANEPARNEIIQGAAERLLENVSVLVNSDKASLLITIDEAHKKTFYCAPACIAILKPDGELWLVSKITRKKAKAEHKGRWRIDGLTLELDVPPDRRHKQAQTYRIPVETNPIGKWLEEARQPEWFSIQPSEAITAAIATASEQSVPVDLVHMSREEKNSRGIRMRIADTSLQFKMGWAMRDAIVQQVEIEREAEKLAEEARALAESERLEEERQAKQEQRRQSIEAVWTALAVNELGTTEIAAVQRALNNAGFPLGAADGVWGKRSAVAIRNWMIRHRKYEIDDQTVRNFNELGGKAPDNKVYIFDDKGDRVAEVDCNRGEQLFLSGQLVACGSIVQR